MNKEYKKNKNSKVGDICICPSCGTKFIKKHYQQVFCKSFSGTVCKDKFWNTVTPSKRNNTTRISPRNRKYYNEVICNDNDGIEALGLDFLLDCGSWD
jgi:hypothetical protein